MNEVDRAWVAGLLEGEGYFFAGKTVRAVRIGCGMTDIDILERLKDKTGYGNISGPYHKGGKPIYQWLVSVRHQAIDLMNEIYPLLGERRRAKIDYINKYHEANPVKRIHRG